MHTPPDRPEHGLPRGSGVLIGAGVFVALGLGIGMVAAIGLPVHAWDEADRVLGPQEPAQKPVRLQAPEPRQVSD